MTKNLTKTKLQALANSIASFAQGDVVGVINATEAALNASGIEITFKEIWAYDGSKDVGYILVGNFSISWEAELTEKDTLKIKAIVSKEA